MSYGQFAEPCLCKSSSLNRGHVFPLILIICNRNVYLHPPRLSKCLFVFFVVHIKLHQCVKFQIIWTPNVRGLVFQISDFESLVTAPPCDHITWCTHFLVIVPRFMFLAHSSLWEFRQMQQKIIIIKVGSCIELILTPQHLAASRPRKCRVLACRVPIRRE